MDNQEQLKTRLNELEEKLSEYNNLIIENDPKSLTEEFELEYRSIQDEYEQLQNEVSITDVNKSENFFNKISLSLFFYFVVMFMLAFPLTVTLISQEIILMFLQAKWITNFTTLQIQTFIVIAFLIYPLSLLIFNFLIRLIFVRSDENKKLYFIWTLIFGGILLLGIVLGFFELVLPVFR